ncbi:MAG: type II secretion system F family protein [Nanoarchaeota archaeon]
MESTITKLRDLVNELKVYSAYREQLTKELAQLQADFRRKAMDAKAFHERQEHLLQGKTKAEAFAYYDAYLEELVHEIEEYAAELFYKIYNDRSFSRHKEQLERMPKPEHHKAAQPLKVALQELPIVLEKAAKPTPKEQPEPEPKVPALPQPVQIVPRQRFSWLKRWKDALSRRFQKKRKVEQPWLTSGKPTKKENAARSLKAVEEKLPREEIKALLSFSFVRSFFRKKEQKEMIQEKTELEPALLKIRKLKEMTLLREESDVTDTLLRQEAKRIKGILRSRPAVSIYEPSSLGSVANLTVRRVSLFLIETFPDLFKSLYNNLRAANIKILSNTYVNIIVLCCLVVFSLFFLAFTAFFSITTGNVLIGLLRGLVGGVIGAIGSLVLFFYYPTMRIKSRRRSINTNLSFAINHMAAVAGSGVTPVVMFRLIAQSKEYGEISVEIEKIAIYVDVYGYDVLSAIKAVSATGPSQELSEFFDGFVSTIGTGGDLKSYLKQKADESLLNYRLERQKYLENISTYSDVYTGILIASPLFFVVALTLVNMLGGTIGGQSVPNIMLFGTYVIVPLLNIGFLLFLEATQPEV